MKLNAYLETDVLVIGAGLAGITAAVSAAECGARVCIVSSSRICSGSSFYPGTWGFGLIGPENETDQKDLKKTIMRVGEGMAVPELTDTFTENMTDSIRYLERMGVTLKKAENKTEREFIPCFDYKCREWNGIIKEDFRQVSEKRMKILGIQQIPFFEVTELVKEDGKVTGAIGILGNESPLYLSAKAVVLATGGMGGLFCHCLTTEDVGGMGQYLALMAGAELVNLEFMQMMPGFLHPAPKTVFNEKVFRYIESPVFDGWNQEELTHILEIRSGHGPYTTRLASGRVDEAIFEAWMRQPEGVEIRYKTEQMEQQPEFVKTYFDWLWQEKHVSIQEPVWLGIFAHASNGGIAIDKTGATGVPGLFACGEVTGGMHGADRIGGLSTANGLVFGRLAGQSAARYQMGEPKGDRECCLELDCCHQAESLLAQVKKDNMKRGMIVRSGTLADEGICQLDEMFRLVEQGERPKDNSREDIQNYLITCRLKAALALSSCLMRAIAMRKESRGPHHRVDALYKEKSFDFRIYTFYNKKTGMIQDRISS